MSDRVISDAQKCLDVMFEILSRVHGRDQVPKDREEVMAWARRQLRLSGFDVVPMGLSHAVIRQPVLCEEDPDWDWWLNLPQEHRSVVVRSYRGLLKHLEGKNG